MAMSKTRGSLVRGRIRGLYCSRLPSSRSKGVSADAVVSAGSHNGISRDGFAGRLRLINRGNPGDVLMLTAAVRDLCLAFPGEFAVRVETAYPELWGHNPYVDWSAHAQGAAVDIDCSRPPLLER